MYEALGWPRTPPSWRIHCSCKVRKCSHADVKKTVHRAYRWRHSALVEGLDALTAILRIAPRPAAIVVGRASGPDAVGALEILRAAGGCPLTPAAHTEALERATEWLTERLT